MPKLDNTLRVFDNDADEITVTLNGRELRGWNYATDAERRTKMLCAREYVDGFYDGITLAVAAVDAKQL